MRDIGRCRKNKKSTFAISEIVKKQKEYFKTLDVLLNMPLPKTDADIKEMLNIVEGLSVASTASDVLP